MAQGRLSDRYQQRLDRAAKRGKDSFNVTRNGKKSSDITQSTVDAIRSDEDVALEIAEDNTKRIEEAIDGAVARALEEIGLAAERFAKRETPVDTGRLRNSITHAISMDEQAVYVGTNVEYGPAVEFGTSRPKREGVHMLQHAASNHGDYYRNIMKKNLQG